MQIEAVDVRTGTKLVLDGEVYIAVDYYHGTPGRGRGFMRIKMKHIKTGRVLEKTFASKEKIERAEMETKNAQYLYNDGNLHFMDNETYEQFSIPADIIGDSVKFLKENMNVEIEYFNNEPIYVDLPYFVEMEVTFTEPGMRGDTVSGASKPATLETGAVVQVPLFINIGDVLKVDTRTGQYVERANK